MLSATGSLLLVPMLSVELSASGCFKSTRHLGADVPLEVERHREGMHQLAWAAGHGAVQISPPTAAMNGELVRHLSAG